MAGEKQLGDVLQDIFDAKKNGALYVSIVETSEDLFRIYFKDGAIYHMRYGTAVGNECLEILEYYTLYSASFFQGIRSPEGQTSPDLPEAREIIARIRKLDKPVKVR